MLKKIKSTYFSKNVFSYLNERIKLNIIKYNKALQKIANINIINYKIFTRSYIIIEKNEKIKIYNSYTNQLLLEGEIFKRKNKW